MTVRERLCTLLRCCPVPRPAVRIVFRFAPGVSPVGALITLADDTGVAQMQKLTATQRVTLAFRAEDAEGNEATVDTATKPVWTSGDETIAKLEVAPDGLSAVIHGGKVGTTVVQVTADAKIGDGETLIFGSLEVEVLPGEAVSIAILPGVPEEDV